MEIVTQKKILHSNNSGPCIDHGERQTFQDQPKIAFNKLPINIRSNESKIIFNRPVRDFIRTRLLLGLCLYKTPPYNFLSTR